MNPNKIGGSRRTSSSSISTTSNPNSNSQESLLISSSQDFISDIKRIKNNKIHKINIDKDIKKLKNNFENIFKAGDNNENAIEIIKQLQGSDISFLEYNRIITNAEAKIIRFAKTIGTTAEVYEDNIRLARYYIEICRNKDIDTIDFNDYNYLESFPGDFFKNIPSPERIKSFIPPKDTSIQIMSSALDVFKNNEIFTINLANSRGCIITNGWDRNKTMSLEDFHRDQLKKFSTDINLPTSNDSTINKESYRLSLKNYTYFNENSFNDLANECTVEKLFESFNVAYIPEEWTLKDIKDTLVNMKTLLDDNKNPIHWSLDHVIMNSSFLYDKQSVEGFKLLKAEFSPEVRVILSETNLAEEVVATDNLLNLRNCVENLEKLLIRANKGTDTADAGEPVKQSELAQATLALDTAINHVNLEETEEAEALVNNAKDYITRVEIALNRLQNISAKTSELSDTISQITVNKDTDTLEALNNKLQQLDSKVINLDHALEEADNANLDHALEEADNANLPLHNTDCRISSKSALEQAKELQNTIEDGIDGINEQKQILSTTKTTAQDLIGDINSDYKEKSKSQIDKLTQAINDPNINNLAVSDTVVTKDALIKTVKNIQIDSQELLISEASEIIEDVNDWFYLAKQYLKPQNSYPRYIYENLIEKKDNLIKILEGTYDKLNKYMPQLLFGSQNQDLSDIIKRSKAKLEALIKIKLNVMPDESDNNFGNSDIKVSRHDGTTELANLLQNMDTTKLSDIKNLLNSMKREDLISNNKRKRLDMLKTIFNNQEFILAINALVTKINNKHQPQIRLSIKYMKRFFLEFLNDESHIEKSNFVEVFNHKSPVKYMLILPIYKLTLDSVWNASELKEKSNIQISTEVFNALQGIRYNISKLRFKDNMVWEILSKNFNSLAINKNN